MNFWSAIILLVLVSVQVDSKDAFRLPVNRHQHLLEIHPEQSEYFEKGLTRVRKVEPRVTEQERKGWLQNTSYNSDKDVFLYANLIEYYVTMSIGTPAQLQNVQVDTGSALVFISVSVLLTK